jgi:hypothetical protein
MRCGNLGLMHLFSIFPTASGSPIGGAVIPRHIDALVSIFFQDADQPDRGIGPIAATFPP